MDAYGLALSYSKKVERVMYASLIIAAIPTFIIFVFCQNIIMRGIVVPGK